MLSGIISMKIVSLQNTEASSRRNFISETWANIVESIYRSNDLYSNLIAPDGAMKLLNATGIILSKGNKFQISGKVPHDGALDELILWLHTRTLRKVFATDSMRHHYEYAKDFGGDAAGMLVIPIDFEKDQYLILFRTEKVKMIDWGGNPEERIQFEKNEKN
jgi:light-regulated signal transduction histidine kinase (bacteriophytochrome)